MNARHEAYYELSSRLALMEDRALQSLLGQRQAGQGWGGNRVLEIAGRTVFAKSVPLTQRELERPYCTKNLFEMPTFYNYGVGSAGFGAFRELAGHVRTTNWVLSGAMVTFPLMYHHRILPRTDPPKRMSAERLDGYIEYWEGSPEIRSYIEARMDAEHELVLFLEHVPHVLFSWLGANQDRLPMVMAGMKSTTDFLQAQGVVHFDAHLANILTDGEQIYLTDFGLVLDRAFDLSREELAFLDAHKHYDDGEFIACLLQPIRAQIRDWDEAKQEALGLDEGKRDASTILDRLGELRAAGHIKLDPDYHATLERYRPVIERMDGFFENLQDKSKREGGYDDGALRRRLREAREAEGESAP